MQTIPEGEKDCFKGSGVQYLRPSTRCLCLSSACLSQWPVPRVAAAELVAGVVGVKDEACP